MSSQAIADAIAARFVGVSVTLDGQVETLSAADATARLPDGISHTPFLIVLPPTEGELDVGVSKLRADVLEYPVQLFLAGEHRAKRAAALHAWYDATRDEVEKRNTLGLAYVSWAQPVSVRSGLGIGEYEGEVFDLIEYVIRVRLWEVVPTVNP